MFPFAGEPQKFDPTFRGPIHNRYASCPHVEYTPLTLCVPICISKQSVCNPWRFSTVSTSIASRAHHHLETGGKQDRARCHHPPASASPAFDFSTRRPLIDSVYDLVRPRVALSLGHGPPPPLPRWSPPLPSGLDESMTGRSVIGDGEGGRVGCTRESRGRRCEAKCGAPTPPHQPNQWPLVSRLVGVALVTHIINRPARASRR